MRDLFRQNGQSLWYQNSILAQGSKAGKELRPPPGANRYRRLRMKRTMLRRWMNIKRGFRLEARCTLCRATARGL